MSKFLTIFLFCGFSCIINCSEINNCTCVPFNECLDEDLQKDGIGLLDVRNFEKGACPGHFDVCCNTTTETISAEKTAQKTTGCGYQNAGFFPWSASLLHKKYKKSNYTHKCGVSLVNRRAAITAAHCVNQEQNKGIWTIRLGNVIRIVKKIIIHPAYDEATLQNDISIIILNSPVPNSKKITTICLPPKGTILQNDVTCASPTWIKIHSSNKTYSYLTLSKLPVVPRDNCVKLLRNTRLGHMFQLHKSFICAGGNENEDTCEGNGGSPLVCPVEGQPGRYHQVGIVSWGIGCGTNNVPGVLVKVSMFRDWVDEEFIKNGLEINSYRY